MQNFRFILESKDDPHPRDPHTRAEDTLACGDVLNNDFREREREREVIFVVLDGYTVGGEGEVGSLLWFLTVVQEVDRGRWVSF